MSRTPPPPSPLETCQELAGPRIRALSPLTLHTTSAVPPYMVTPKQVDNTSPSTIRRIHHPSDRPEPYAVNTVQNFRLLFRLDPLP